LRRRILAEELMTLSRLGDEWLIRKIADHENEKSEIAAILERVNDARMQFEVSPGVRRPMRYLNCSAVSCTPISGYSRQ
jgi:hypothetical protein